LHLGANEKIQDDLNLEILHSIKSVKIVVGNKLTFIGLGTCLRDLFQATLEGGKRD
jgi:hypothetical protein